MLSAHTIRVHRLVLITVWRTDEDGHDCATCFFNAFVPQIIPNAGDGIELNSVFLFRTLCIELRCASGPRAFSPSNSLFMGSAHSWKRMLVVCCVCVCCSLPACKIFIKICVGRVQGVHVLDSDELVFMRPDDADEHVRVCGELYSLQSEHINAMAE